MKEAVMPNRYTAANGVNIYDDFEDLLNNNVKVFENPGDEEQVLISLKQPSESSFSLISLDVNQAIRLRNALDTYLQEAICRNV